MISNNYQNQDPFYNNYGTAYQQQMQNYAQNNNYQRQMRVAGARMVRDEREIRPNEVPNNGDIAVFVQNDLGRVFVKTWNGNGLIDTNEYQLVQNTPQGPNPFDLIMDRLDQIENFLTAPDQRQDSNKTTGNADPKMTNRKGENL